MGRPAPGIREPHGPAPALPTGETASSPQFETIPEAASADPIVREALLRHQRGDLDGAEEKYRAALEIAPGHIHASHYLGVVLYQRRRLDEAMPLLEQSAQAVPGEPEFQNNLGLALAAADRNDEAIDAFRNALRLSPDHAIAWNNLGLTLYAACNVPDAIAAYREALARQPNFAEAHWNLALALLANGEYAEGWQEYEWRLRVAALGAGERETPGLLWDGAIRHGLTLLVTTEQGMGDALLFVRYVQPLAERGIRVILLSPPPLAKLLATAPGVAAVVSADQKLPAYDAHVPLMSLPRLLGDGPGGRPAAIPYLRADRVLRADAAIALAPFATALKIGLAWSGNPQNSNDHRRSIPLAQLAPLLRLPGTAWFSLQRAVDERDIGVVPAATAIAASPDARGLRRCGGADRRARSDRERRHGSRPPCGSARASRVGGIAVRAGLALASARRRKHLVSNRAAVPAGRARRLGSGRCADWRRARGPAAFARRFHPAALAMSQRSAQSGPEISE